MPVTSILLVEPVNADATLVMSYLGDREDADGSFQVDRVRTLSEALERLGADQYDAVLLDPALPDSVSDVSITQICDACVRSAALVLVLTSDASRRLFDDAIAACAQDVLLKPEVTASSIRRSIHAAVGRHTRQRLRDLQTANQKPETRQDEALTALRRVNQCDRAPTLKRVEDLTTGSVATETVLAILNERFEAQLKATEDLRLSLKDVTAHQTGLDIKMARLTTRVQPLIEMIEGSTADGSRGLAVRLDRLETKDCEQTGQSAEGRQVWWSLILQMLPVILSWIAAALVYYFAPK
jgi:CheY-like chemotaxis protein